MANVNRRAAAIKGWLKRGKRAAGRAMKKVTSRARGAMASFQQKKKRPNVTVSGTARRVSRNAMRSASNAAARGVATGRAAAAGAQAGRAAAGTMPGVRARRRAQSAEALKIPKTRRSR